MTDKTDAPNPFDGTAFTALYENPAGLAQAMFAPMLNPSFVPMAGTDGNASMSAQDMQHWAEVGTKLQGMWLQYQQERMGDPQAMMPFFDPARRMTSIE